MHVYCISTTVLSCHNALKAFLILLPGAAGNFLAPAESLSFNAFRTVMEIDAHGTFNVSKVVFEKYMKVIVFFKANIFQL